jgi:hypothetical protein
MTENKLFEEIDEYCKLNDILDIETFKLKCMQVGFNIEKYGVSPKDNVNKEHQQETKKEPQKKEETKVVKKTRKVKVIKND